MHAPTWFDMLWTAAGSLVLTVAKLHWSSDIESCIPP